ncbi:hypothetical protein FM103_10460 [Corynebacterium xerosis]|nr:hypothetical protein FM103_10460 [Corynebacterium xerosis]
MKGDDSRDATRRAVRMTAPDRPDRGGCLQPSATNGPSVSRTVESGCFLP